MKLLSRVKNEKTRIILFFLLLLTLPFSFQCVKAPLEPKAPQWQVPLNIALIDRTFTFEQMIDKDPKFIVDSSSGTIVYQPSSLVNQPNAIVLPELTPAATSVANKLGLVPLSVPSIPSVSVNFKALFGVDPPPIPYPGPDASATLNDTLANLGATFDYVVFANGRMSLTITNTFPFAINIQNPGVQLINVDQGGAVVATFVFASIGAGLSSTSTASVSGKLMSANLKMNFTFQTSGITGKTITSTEQLSAQLGIDGGSVGSAATLQSAAVQLNADYPVASIPDSAIQLIDDSTKIKRAEFKDGKFQIKIANGVAADVHVNFALSEFVNRITGKPFVLTNDATGDTSGIIAANSIFIQTVNMSNYAIQSQQFAVVGGKTDTLSTPNVHFSISIKTLAATKKKVVISKDDSVRVDVTPLNNNQSPPRKTYVLSKVIGKLKPTVVSINQTVDASIGDVGNKFTADNIKFDSVSITLNILSTGLFPTDLLMKVVGLDSVGNPRATLVAQDLKPGGGLTDTLRIYPGQTKKIVFDKSTSNGNNGIDQFLSSFFSTGSGSLPSKLQVVGQAVIDPASYYQYADSTGTVATGDSVFTSMQFSFPVTIGIINGTFRDTVVISDSSGNKIDKQSLTQIDSGNVIFTIYNGFPLQLTVGTKLLPGLAYDKSKPDTAVLLSLPKTGLIVADSARYVSNPNSPIGLTGTVISLDTADVGKINPASFAAVTIRLNTSGSNVPVEFKKSYYVQLKAFVSVRYNVDFDKLK
ncbi:MAG: hypothetical protein WBZ48_10465 [Bacteroidota bacterium]